MAAAVVIPSPRPPHPPRHPHFRSSFRVWLGHYGSNGPTPRCSGAGRDWYALHSQNPAPHSLLPRGDRRRAVVDAVFSSAAGRLNRCQTRRLTSTPGRGNAARTRSFGAPRRMSPARPAPKSLVTQRLRPCPRGARRRRGTATKRGQYEEGGSYRLRVRERAWPFRRRLVGAPGASPRTHSSQDRPPSCSPRAASFDHSGRAVSCAGRGPPRLVVTPPRVAQARSNKVARCLWRRRFSV